MQANLKAQLRPVVIRNRADRSRIEREDSVIGFVPGRFGWFVLQSTSGQVYRVPTDDPSVLNRHSLIAQLDQN